MMFLSLKRPLEQGGTVKATLKFERAGTIDVEYPVLAIGAPAPGASAGGSMMQESGGAMHRQGGSMQGGGMMQMDKPLSRDLPADPSPAYAGSRNPGFYATTGQGQHLACPTPLKAASAPKEQFPELSNLLSGRFYG